jgi:hypothetical protein
MPARAAGLAVSTAGVCFLATGAWARREVSRTI